MASQPARVGEREPGGEQCRPPIGIGGASQQTTALCLLKELQLAKSEQPEYHTDEPVRNGATRKSKHKGNLYDSPRTQRESVGAGTRGHGAWRSHLGPPK